MSSGTTGLIASLALSRKTNLPGIQQDAKIEEMQSVFLKTFLAVVGMRIHLQDTCRFISTLNLSLFGIVVPTPAGSVKKAEVLLTVM
jgi:hypothetical protein